VYYRLLTVLVVRMCSFSQWFLRLVMA